MSEVSCYDCIHCDVCSGIGSCSYHCSDVSKCKYYKNKADVAPVKHGEWDICCDGYYPYCSECGYEPPWANGRDMRTKYCPECGAKMKGGNDD